MDKLIEQIEGEIAGLTHELESCKKTAASAARARKHTGNLTKLFKEFRKVSVAHHKK